MRLLLDTHIWVWSRAEPGRLSGTVAQALENEASELWLSPLSIGEVLLLVEKGRLLLRPTAEDWIRAAMATASIREAPLTSEVALATREIRLPHRDPVDHLLAATARVFDLTLVSADEHVLHGRGFHVLANR